MSLKWKRHVVSRGWNSLSFPLHTLDGRLVGVQHYRPLLGKRAKYNTYQREKAASFYGVHSLVNPGPIYLVEGIFKAIKLHQLGFAALAVLGADLTHKKQNLKLLTRPCICIGDADKAGARMVAQWGTGFQSPKDLDEMTDEEVLKLIQENPAKRRA